MAHTRTHARTQHKHTHTGCRLLKWSSPPGCSWLVPVRVTACFSGTKEGPSRLCFVCFFYWNDLRTISQRDSEFCISEAAAAHKPPAAHLEQIEIISHLPLGRFLGNWAQNKAHQTPSLHWFSCSLTPCRGLYFLFVSKLNRPVNWWRAHFTPVGEKELNTGWFIPGLFRETGKTQLFSYSIALSLPWPLRWAFIKN